MLGLKLNYVSKMGHRPPASTILTHYELHQQLEFQKWLAFEIVVNEQQLSYKICGWLTVQKLAHHKPG